MSRFPALPALALALAFALSGQAAAGGIHLVEPSLTLPGPMGLSPRVALTLDACSGKADSRIFQALVDNRIPATVFVTARWLKRNPEATRLMLDHPALFQMENHGARHVPAVNVPATVYGIAAAGSSEAVKAEVEAGAEAVRAATGQSPRWYRGATARYNQGAITEIAGLGQAVAGFSLNADQGAMLPAAAVEKRLARAKAGDVIIAHVNHPERSSGEGLVRGILALKAKGFVLVKLGPPPTPSRHAS